MNYSKATKARLKVADRMRQKPEGEWKQIDLSKRDHLQWMTRAYSNNRYIVTVMDHAPTDKGEAIRVMIQVPSDRPIPNHWSELQRIKSELFGKETTAIEYYPAESELVDKFNIYWLWIFPEGVLPKPILP